MMRSAFERRGRIMHRMLNEIPGVTCLEPAGRVLLLPVLRGPARPGDRRAAASTRRWQLADVVLDEAKVALVPGEAFGSPGYMRLSFALGDDDLGRWAWRRLQELFA